VSCVVVMADSLVFEQVCVSRGNQDMSYRDKAITALPRNVGILKVKVNRYRRYLFLFGGSLLWSRLFI